MHSAQPLDILFEEAGASLGRIERELRLKDEARAAKFEARLAAIELAAFKAEEDRQRKFEARMAELRDGKDGEPGRDGRDADVEPFRQEFQETLAGYQAQIREFVSDERAIVKRIDAKLAEVKDGKDGKDGEPGSDADVEPFMKDVSEHVHNTIVEMEDKVNAKLAEVKDGKDGGPGKDADTQLILDSLDEEFSRQFAGLEDRLDQRLAEIRDGKDGKDGEEGLPGKDGKDGQDGKMPIAREWTNRVHYEGDVVRHNGSTYQALADTGREPPHGDWGELASRGTDGIGFVLRGTYDASAEYRQHDIVMINRNSFAAKYDNPGECPGDGWQLFGPSGQRGKEGPPGSPGAKGADGRLVSITKWEADPDEMVLRIADSTGNTFTVDLQPIAERIVEAAR